MPEPRFRRRKEERPQEITEAALAAFAEKGYAATRVDDVAKRAGVSKGLLYLYFKTKEELFKAVVRGLIVPRVDAFKAVVRGLIVPRVDALIGNVDSTELSAEEFIRGPFLDFAKTVPGSPISIVIRLMIAEGSKHPDLVQYYWDEVVSRGLATMSNLLEQGVKNGEFRRSAVNELPHLLIMPVVFSVIFNLLFEKQSLDTDRLIETHIDMLLLHMKGQES
jgi:AcrR family transcriptional regulator